MLRILLSLLMLIGFGASLAFSSLSLGFSTGWIGAGAMICWALLARQRWRRLSQTTGADPGGPERVLWHRLTGTGILLGHLSIGLLNPHIDLHVGSGNTLAIDSWTILVAMMISALLFHADARECDERHREVSARGVRAGYLTLIILLLILLFYLGFAPPNLLQAFDHWLIANLLSGLITASLVVMFFAQLAGYAADSSREEIELPLQ